MSQLVLSKVVNLTTGEMQLELSIRVNGQVVFQMPLTLEQFIKAAYPPIPQFRIEPDTQQQHYQYQQPQQQSQQQRQQTRDLTIEDVLTGQIEQL